MLVHRPERVRRETFRMRPAGCCARPGRIAVELMFECLPPGIHDVTRHPPWTAIQGRRRGQSHAGVADDLRQSSLIGYERDHSIEHRFERAAPGRLPPLQKD